MRPTLNPILRFPTALRRTLLRLPLLLALLIGSWSASASAAFESAVYALSQEDATVLSNAIGELGTLDDPRALAVLTALAAGELSFDENKNAFIKTSAAVIDAKTSAPGTPIGKLTVAKINNAMRRSLGPALAQSQLRAKDPEVRLLAATELFKRPTAELHDAIQAAVTTETNSEVKELLMLALAQLDLDSTDSSRRLSALESIRESGSVLLKGRVETMTRQESDGSFTEKDAAVREKAGSVLAGLERRIFLISSVANLFYGLSLGSVLLLAALGLAITFGILRVINMAHGEMLMLGAYSTFAVQNLFKAYAPGLLDWYLLLAIPVAFIVSAAVGAFLERTVIRFLYGRPLETLLATWGISLALIQTVRLIFGAQNVAVANPSWLSGGWELMPNVVLPYSRIATIVFSALVVAFVWILMQRTRLGMYVRAVTQNRDMAGSVGIPTRNIDVWTFALGSGVAGLGGVAISQLGNVGPELGQGYIVDSFMVVVLGGVGNIVGTIAGALGLGIVNKFLEPAMGAVLGKILVLGIIILFIQWRPQGMFALKGRAAEL
jgi:urea transport system permease protein